MEGQELDQQIRWLVYRHFVQTGSVGRSGGFEIRLGHLARFIEGEEEAVSEC